MRAVRRVLVPRVLGVAVDVLVPPFGGAKEAGIKVVPVYSGDDHGAKQVDRWVDTYKDHAEFGYVFRENARDVLNKQNPTSVKGTLEFLASLLG